MNITSMSQLKEKAIQMEDQTEMYFSLDQKTERFELTKHIQSFKQQYAYCSGVISFVDENGIFYVIPNLNGTEETLKAAGYTRTTDLYVPFTGFSYPLAHEEKWITLCEEQRAS